MLFYVDSALGNPDGKWGHLFGLDRRKHMKLAQYFEYESDAVIKWAKNLLINCLPDFWIINRYVRPALARFCGAKCGPGVILQKGIFYGNPKRLQIGAKSAISRGGFLDGYEKITIGDNVAIAFDVTFVTGTHELGPKEKRAGNVFGKPVVIGDGVWIAAGAIIGPGTEIGAGSMVSAGAAVMQSVAPNSLVAGVPGRVMTALGSGAALSRSPEPGPAVSTVKERGVPAKAAAQEDRGQRIPSPPADSGREKPVAATPKPAATHSGKDGTWARAEFYAALEALLELEPGRIQGSEYLGELGHWDSMAVLAFMALADSKLKAVVSPPALVACKTVSDLVNLFPGKII